MEILLLFSLAQHFDIEVEDTWKFCCYSGNTLHFDTGVGLMEILLLYSLAQHFDTGVEDSWKFCCHSKQSLQPISSRATACKQLGPRN